MRKCKFLAGKSQHRMLDSSGKSPRLVVYVQLEEFPMKFYCEINRNITFKHFGMFSHCWPLVKTFSYKVVE